MVCHSVLDFSTRSRLWFGWPAGWKTAALSPPWIYAEARVWNGAKTGLVWGF